MIQDFMRAAKQDTPDFPTVPSQDVQDLRYSLISEELGELDMAQASEDPVEVADAIADLLVVVLGAAVAWGIDIEPVFEEVHRSNMTKFIDGHKRADGKWIKGPSYSPPEIAPIIQAQMPVVP
jgi:predicted HAD superfamily Cof-like phosphohydrolase